MGTMSKEEILKILEGAKDKNSDVPMRLVRQAFEKLPEPCEDAVSRKKVFEYFVSLWECIGTIMDRDEWEDVCKTTANELPSAQLEIVRCKDCQHRYVDGENVRFNVCELNHNKVQSDDWFCADAERKEGEVNG